MGLCDTQQNKKKKGCVIPRQKEERNTYMKYRRKENVKDS